MKTLEPFLNKIHNADCLELMPQFPAKSIDLIVTSPPYNIKTSSGGGFPAGVGKWPGAKMHEGYETTDDAMPHLEYIDWQRRCLSEMMHVLKDDGAIFYNHKWRVQDGLLQDRSDIVAGFPVRQIIIWQRSGGVNFNEQYFLPTYEVIYLIAKKDFRLAPKANAVGDVWKITQARNNDHPAPMPVELARRCIKSTNAKIVLDPFVGSGTTAVAAMLEGLDYVGIDISGEYCRMAVERLKRPFTPPLWEKKTTTSTTTWNPRDHNIKVTYAQGEDAVPQESLLT